MLGQISSKPGVSPVLGQISSKPGVSPVLEQISGQTRGFASARANSRPGGGATPVLGQISGQKRGFASARAKFRARARVASSPGPTREGRAWYALLAHAREFNDECGLKRHR